MQKNALVYIVMSTYNGDSYLKLQLNSLLEQTYKNWHLIIRDDGSNDDSLKIIKAYSLKDKRIELISDSLGNLKSCQSFGNVMQYVSHDAEYIMFCDQDDIWKPEKVEYTLREINILGSKYGFDLPLMVYGTYEMINEFGSKLPIPNPNYSEVPSIKLLLTQNYIYGCTMMINSKLRDIILPIPNTAENHDYWISLIAVLVEAKISYIEKPLLYYRQHANNVSGSYIDASFLKRIKRMFRNEEKKLFIRRLKMFKSLTIQVVGFEDNKQLVRNFNSSFYKGKLNWLVFCLTNGIRRRGFLRTILYYLNVLRINTN